MIVAVVDRLSLRLVPDELWELAEPLIPAFESRPHRLAIVSWIETKYHRKRRQRGLGKLTPVEFETIYTTAAAA